MSRILLLVSIVFALAAWILPGEITKWRVAAARNQLSNGEVQQANDILESLAEASPNDRGLQLEWLKGMTAAKDLPRIQQLAGELNQKFPDNPDVAEELAQAFHELGAHKLAYQNLAKAEIKLIRQMQESGEGSNLGISQINNLAYFSFLASSDTQLWHQWMNRSLGTNQEVSFAIYRAEGLRLVGEPDRSAAILEEQLNRLERIKKQTQSRWQQELNRWMSHRDWPTEETENLANQRTNLMNLQVLIARVAKQGWKSTQGTENLNLRERFRKAQLLDSAAPNLESAGDGDSTTFEVFAQVDSPKLVCQQLGALTTLFDTRGCLAMANDDYQQAMTDFDNCIEAITVIRALSESVDLWNSNEFVEADKISKFREQKEKSWAVIYHHRLQLKKKLGDDQVDLDQQRIRDLGYDPVADLF